jgi:hypothetical protein
LDCRTEAGRRVTGRLPTQTSLQALIDSTRALHQKPRDRRLPDPTLLAAIERRLLTAVHRDNTGTTERDGYRFSTLGGGFGGTNTSTTEAHALSDPQKDKHHEFTSLACSSLEEAVHQINKLISALNSIDDLTSDHGPTPRTCAACTGHRPLGGDQAVAHRGTVGNRLERDTDLCAGCYAYVVQSAPAGSRTGHLPDPLAIRWHDQRGRWRLRISA